MSGQFYDNADRRTYQVDAAALSGGAAILYTFQGPAGKTGRVREIEYLITTTVTVADATITVGENAAVLPPGLTIEQAAAGIGGGFTAAERLAAGAEEVAGVNDVLLSPDTPVEIATGGESTAGAANIVVTVEWF